MNIAQDERLYEYTHASPPQLNLSRYINKANLEQTVLQKYYRSNDRYIIDISKYSYIDSVWLEILSLENKDRISVYYIRNNIDPFSITHDTAPIDMDILCHHKMTGESLKIINEYFDENRNKDLYNIPFIDSVSSVQFVNYKMVILIDAYTEELYIKYIKGLSNIITNDTPLPSLIKHVYCATINAIAGDNIANIHTNNMALTDIIIIGSDIIKDVVLKPKYIYCSDIASDILPFLQGSKDPDIPKDLRSNLLWTWNDYSFRTSNCYYHTSSTFLKQDSQFSFISEKNTTINVIYIFEDCIAFNNDIAYMVSQEDVSLDYSSSSNSTPSSPITVTPTDPMDSITTEPMIPMIQMPPYVSPVNINTLYTNLMDKIELTIAENHVYSDDIKCVISYDYVQKGETYYKCNQCKAVYNNKLFKEWLAVSATCPHCRLEFKEFPKLYCNGGQEPKGIISRIIDYFR